MWIKDELERNVQFIQPIYMFTKIVVWSSCGITTFGIREQLLKKSTLSQIFFDIFVNMMPVYKNCITLERDVCERRNPRQLIIEGVKKIISWNSIWLQKKKNVCMFRRNIFFHCNIKKDEISVNNTSNNYSLTKANKISTFNWTPNNVNHR